MSVAACSDTCEHRGDAMSAEAVMNERSRVARLQELAIVLLTLGMAACSSGTADTSPGVGEAFASKTMAVCQAALAQKEAQGPFPYPTFNPSQPDPSKLPDVARFLTGTVDTFQTWLREMQGLGQPPTGQEEWASLLEAIERATRLDVEQQAAAERGDTETFTKDYYAGVETQDQLALAAEAAGVPECSAVDAVGS